MNIERLLDYLYPSYTRELVILNTPLLDDWEFICIKTTGIKGYHYFLYKEGFLIKFEDSTRNVVDYHFNNLYIQRMIENVSKELKMARYYLCTIESDELRYISSEMKPFTL